VRGVYCRAHINYKSKSTAQNVLGVKPKFEKPIECENNGS